MTLNTPHSEAPQRVLARVGDYGKVMALLLPLWLALVGLTYTLFRLAESPLPLRVVLLESLTLYLAMFALVPLAQWAARVILWKAGHPRGPLAQHACLLTVFCSLDYLLERSLYLLIDPAYAGIRSRLTLLSAGPEGFFATACLATPFYVLTVVAHHAFNEHKELQERALWGAQLEAQYGESRLQALKSQLQPHFLFNALNALCAHIPPESETAQRMVVLLSTFLRRSLQEMDLQRVSLRHELESVRLYLEIQQLRFSNRVRFLCEVAEDVQEQVVPHLLLQPLVENAIKHGLAPKLDPGTVWIRAFRDEAALHLSVLDDGVGPQTCRSLEQGAGVGLANLRKRLHHLYGDRATFACGPRAEGGFQALIQIPLARSGP